MSVFCTVPQGGSCAAVENCRCGAREWREISDVHSVSDERSPCTIERWRSALSAWCCSLSPRLPRSERRRFAFGVDGSDSLNQFGRRPYPQPQRTLGLSDVALSPAVAPASSCPTSPTRSMPAAASRSIRSPGRRQHLRVARHQPDQKMGKPQPRRLLRAQPRLRRHLRRVPLRVERRRHLRPLQLRQRCRNRAAKPGIAISRRFADDLSEDSFIYSFKLDAERKIVEKWWWTLTPRIRRQHFLGGENVGRVDTIYSISTGVRYTINEYFQAFGSDSATTTGIDCGGQRLRQLQLRDQPRFQPHFCEASRA